MAPERKMKIDRFSLPKLIRMFKIIRKLEILDESLRNYRIDYVGDGCEVYRADGKIKKGL